MIKSIEILDINFFIHYKKIGILSVALSISLMATQGDNLIGAGVKSRSLGGAAISTYLGVSHFPASRLPFLIL